MRTSLTIIIGCFFLFGFQCRKEGDEFVIGIQGFRIVDALGNEIGSVGSSADDWIVYDRLDDRVMSLFNFNTSLGLDNTTEATIVTPAVAYPNPFTNLQYYAFRASDSVMFLPG